MGDASYLAKGLGHADWLHSARHAAGRRMRRQEVRALRLDTTAVHDWQCMTLREERRIEVAPPSGRQHANAVSAFRPVDPPHQSSGANGSISGLGMSRSAAGLMTCS